MEPRARRALGRNPLSRPQGCRQHNCKRRLRRRQQQQQQLPPPPQQQQQRYQQHYHNQHNHHHNPYGPTTPRTMIITSLVAGAVAGGVAKTCIAPLDRTKIHFQIHDSKFSVRKAAKFLVHTYTRHGFTALWRGNSATMVRIIPYAALQYCSHEQFKIMLKVDTNERKKGRQAQSFLAGSLAGLFSSICTYPLDLARARMAVSDSDKVRLSDVFKTLVRKNGYLALYRGFLPSIIGIVPYAGVTFFTYETAKRLHYEYSGKDEPSHLQRMAFGALAGLLGQSASYPLDVIRRRMQTSDIKLGMIETALRILADPNPIRSIYRGLSLNWVKGPMSVGISFATFDLLTKTLRQ